MNTTAMVDNQTLANSHYEGDYDDLPLQSYNDVTLKGLSGSTEPFEMFVNGMGVVQSVVSVIGLVGNVLVLCILSRPAFKDQVMSIFLRYLAVSDLLRLLVYFIGMSPTVRVYDKLITFNAYCRFIEFSSSFTNHLASFALIPISLERFTAVYFPFKVKQIFTHKAAVVIILAITAAMILINLFLPLSVGVVDTEYGKICFIADETLLFIMDNIFVWVDFTVYFAIPFAVLLFCNAAIITKIIKQRSVKARLTQSAVDRKISSMTWMLILVSLAYLVLACPAVLMLAFINPFDLSAIPEQQRPMVVCVFSVLFTLTTANHSINFLLYSVTMPKFRDEFSKIICCKSVVQKVQGMSTGTKTSRLSISKSGATPSEPIGALERSA